MILVFDVMGTLFSLDRVRQALRNQDIQEGFLEFWFLRLLHSATSCTLAGQYRSFAELMPTTLNQSLAVRGYAHKNADTVLLEMQHLELWEDCQSSLSALKRRGFQLIALTNGGLENTRHLMNQAGILTDFDAVFSCDEAMSCKPHPKPYQMVLNHLQIPANESCMVAAHAWDIMGAHGVGMQTIWISRAELLWTFPGNPPGKVAKDLKELGEIVVV